MKICLQGGREFDECGRDMDKAVLRRSAGGPVVVLPLAVPAKDYASVGERASAWYRSLGASDVVVAPDPREDPRGARSALDASGLVVLPDGSARALHDALTTTGMDEALRAAAERGATLSGSAAGGMVLCEMFVDALLVDAEDAEDEGRLVSGLGLVPAVLLPSYTSGLRPAWLRDVAEGFPVFGVGECSGVLVADGTVMALGVHRTRVISDGTPVAVLDPGTTRDVW